MRPGTGQHTARNRPTYGQAEKQSRPTYGQAEKQSRPTYGQAEKQSRPTYGQGKKQHVRPENGPTAAARPIVRASVASGPRPALSPGRW